MKKTSFQQSSTRGRISSTVAVVGRRGFVVLGLLCAACSSRVLAGLRSLYSSGRSSNSSLGSLLLIDSTSSSTSQHGDLTSEWKPTHNLAQEFSMDETALQSATKSIAVHIPGVAQPFSVPFYDQKPQWLAKRTFHSRIFFCPPNGHEGTITHLIGQLLYQNPEGSFMDVGSNLGFYSLLAVAMGRDAYAFDIQPVCLYNLSVLAASAADASSSKPNLLLHLYNIGMSDRAQTVINAEGGCDYENFYVASSTEEERRDKVETVVDVRKAGMGVSVPVVSMDHWMQSMDGQLKGPIQVLKMDTEGAEGRIAMGMQQTLSTCLIRNWIVELTPAHWFRFGQDMDDPAAIQAFVDVTEKHNYKAYFMFMTPERSPPPSLHDFIRPLSQHPTMPSERDTGCFGAPYYEILDMRRFIHEYCLEFADTVVRNKESTAKGYCGNIWFQKQGC